MKFVLIFLIAIQCYGQIDTILDYRDGQSYRIIQLNGKNWMIDNLNYETDQSLELGLKESSDSGIEGRFYPYFETDSICPNGWEIPSSNDWTNYFQFIYDRLNVESPIQESKKKFPAVIHMFVKSDKLNLFTEQNRIELKTNFMIEGGQLIKTPLSAHYWSLNRYEEFPKKSHTHITKNSLTIHSHKGHLQRNKPKKMRMFMVRCVSEIY